MVFANFSQGKLGGWALGNKAHGAIAMLTEETACRTDPPRLRSWAGYGSPADEESCLPWLCRAGNCTRADLPSDLAEE